jgi:hypothetical protein
MPFGASVRAHMKTQICNGQRARMVLYHYDFCDDRGPEGGKLNEHGMARLGDIVRMFPCSCFHPIVIERTRCNPALDAARRDCVVRALNRMNAAVPEQLVVIGRPETPGLSGEEAVILHKKLMDQTKLPPSETSGAGVNGAVQPGVGVMPSASVP